MSSPYSGKDVFISPGLPFHSASKNVKQILGKGKRVLYHSLGEHNIIFNIHGHQNVDGGFEKFHRI